jgi:cytochrome c553
MAMQFNEGTDDQVLQQCIRCHQKETPAEVKRYEDSAHAKLPTPVTCVTCHGREGHGQYVAMGFQFRQTVVDPDGKAMGSGRVRTYSDWQSKMILRATVGCASNGCHAQAVVEHTGLNRRASKANNATNPFHGMVRYDHGISAWSDVMLSSFGLGIWENYGADMFQEACVRCHWQSMAWNVSGPDMKSMTETDPFLGSMLAKQAKDIPEFARNNIPGATHESLLVTKCVECHTRHEFSKKSARLEMACAKCHSGPDHPQMESYDSSRHRAVVDSRGIFSKDNLGGGPTCSTCHLSEVNGVTSHDLTRGLAANYTFKSVEWAAQRTEMLDRCAPCHASAIAGQQLLQADRIVYQLQRPIISEIKRLCKEGYRRGLMQAPVNPLFESPIEFMPDSFHAFATQTGKYRVSAFEQECWDAWRDKGTLAMETGAWHFSPQWMYWQGHKSADQHFGKIREMLDHAPPRAKR